VPGAGACRAFGVCCPADDRRCCVPCLASELSAHVNIYYSIDTELNYYSIASYKITYFVAILSYDNYYINL